MDNDFNMWSQEQQLRKLENSFSGYHPKVFKGKEKIGQARATSAAKKKVGAPPGFALAKKVVRHNSYETHLVILGCGVLPQPRKCPHVNTCSR